MQGDGSQAEDSSRNTRLNEHSPTKARESDVQKEVESLALCHIWLTPSFQTVFPFVLTKPVISRTLEVPPKGQFICSKTYTDWMFLWEHPQSLWLYIKISQTSETLTPKRRKRKKGERKKEKRRKEKRGKRKERKEKKKEKRKKIKEKKQKRQKEKEMFV